MMDAFAAGPQAAGRHPSVLDYLSRYTHHTDIDIATCTHGERNPPHSVQRKLGSSSGGQHARHRC